KHVAKCTVEFRYDIAVFFVNFVRSEGQPLDWYLTGNRRSNELINLLMKLPLLLSQTLQSIRIVRVPKFQLYRRQLVTQRTKRLGHQLFLLRILSLWRERE